MNWLKDLRIGYAPLSQNFYSSGDRRRFCFYASKRNLHFEIAKPEDDYDVVVLTQAADITSWSRYPRKGTKIIFDFTDSYLSIPRSDLKGVFRGLAKFATGQNRRLRLSYWSVLRDMCSRADAVICCTLEQRERVLPFCRNVHIILDAHFMVVRSCKQEYSAGRPFHFVWEGLAQNLNQLLEIREPLRKLATRTPFLIHAITQMEYGKYLGGRFGKRNALQEIRKIWPGMALYSWNEQTFSSIVTSCDLALVPLPLHDPICAEKPENRLILFWRSGLPTLASASAANKRAMMECGLDMSPNTPAEWQNALEYYISNEQARRRAGLLGRSFVETRYTEEKVLASWDGVFNSAFGRQSNPIPAGVGGAPVSN